MLNINIQLNKYPFYSWQMSRPIKNEESSLKKTLLYFRKVDPAGKLAIYDKTLRIYHYYILFMPI